METTINQRLYEFCKVKEISQSDLSRILKIGRANVSAWFREKNQRPFPIKYLHELKIKFPDMNEMYIWLGKGEGVTKETDDIEYLLRDKKTEHLLKCPNCERLYGKIESLEKQVKDLSDKNEELLKEVGGLRYLQGRIGKIGT